MPNLPDKTTEVIKTRLDLLDTICGNTGSVKQQIPVISSINEMTRYALNASASSMVLFDEHNKKLVYRYSDGPLGKQFNRLTKREELGITGLVVQKGQPVAVNDIDKDQRFEKFKGEVAGIVARSVIGAPLVVNNTAIGAIEVLNKLDGNDFNEHDLSMLTGLADGAALTIENVRLNENLLYSYRSSLQKLVASADSRETSESKHSRRVAGYALIAANQLTLSEEEQQIIEYGAVLHDIGMLGVPAAILKKKGTLTKEDWSTIRKHPVIGYNLLRGIPSLNQVGKLILYHHERYDGKGYPCGLKGDTIPLGARIISVAEAFDSMTVKHSYRAASTAEEAMKELGKHAGSQFCPDAVKALCMGYIRSRSLERIKPKAEAVVTDYIKSKRGESTIWPISFNQSSRLGDTEKVSQPVDFGWSKETSE